MMCPQIDTDKNSTLIELDELCERSWAKIFIVKVFMNFSALFER